jgi:iron donor protein CyaY
VLTDEEFSKSSSAALEALNIGMDRVADEHDVEILYQGGVLTLEIEEPAPSKIIVSPNSSAGQIWISAQSTSFKLDWSPDTSTFVLPETHESLNTLLGRILGEELGIDSISL